MDIHTLKEMREQDIARRREMRIPSVEMSLLNSRLALAKCYAIALRNEQRQLAKLERAQKNHFRASERTRHCLNNLVEANNHSLI